MSENLKVNDCLIIDHITVFNFHYLDRIKKLNLSKVNIFILIEAGLASCAHNVLRFGKQFQLDED